MGVLEQFILNRPPQFNETSLQEFVKAPERKSYDTRGMSTEQDRAFARGAQKTVKDTTAYQNLNAAIENTTGQVTDFLDMFRSPSWNTANRMLDRVNEGVTGMGMGPMAGTFAGKAARTADLAKLAEAEGLLSQFKKGTPEWQAADRRAWKETGWTHAFPDGKPRFEISDNGARIRDSFAPDKHGNLLVEALDHEGAYTAYPDLVGVRYEKTALTSDYSPSSDYIRAAGAAESPTLHELQHAIQEREGFARGGSVESSERFDALRANHKMLQEHYISQVKEYGRESTQAQRAKEAWNAFESKHLEELQSLSPVEQYRRLAGEAEARLTQKRMNLTPEQRRAQYPIDQFDVPVDQQIVRFDGNTAQSILKGYDYPVLMNPTKDELMGFLNKTKYNEVRGLLDPKTNDLYFAPAELSDHKSMAEMLGISWDDIIDKGYIARKKGSNPDYLLKTEP